MFKVMIKLIFILLFAILCVICYWAGKLNVFVNKKYFTLKQPLYLNCDNGEKGLIPVGSNLFIDSDGIQKDGSRLILYINVEENFGEGMVSIKKNDKINFKAPVFGSFKK